MSKLNLFSNTIQSFSNLLNPMLSAEIMVIDKDLIALAGTGSYRKNVGTKRPRDSYIHRCIISGESYKVDAPRETKQCLRCEIRSFCPYSFVISSPIKHEDEIVGIFGFLGYGHNQRKIMAGKSFSLSRLSDQIANFMEDMFFEKTAAYESFFRSEGLNQIISSVEKGLILTDGSNRIININQFGEKLLGLNKEAVLGKDFKSLENEFQIDISGSNQQIQATNGKAKLFARKIPIKPDCSMSGNIFLFNDRLASKKPRRNYSQILDVAPNQVFIGQSNIISKLRNFIGKISKNSCTVLITGETGTGKELAAKLIQYEGPRKYNPFITINCSAIPASLFESELFGYAGGSFTGAQKFGKTGKFEMANKGTLFLDEIGYLSLEGQAKILRFLENSTLEKVGKIHAQEVDVRIIAATNKNLEKMIQEKLFLEDLYYRLNVIPLNIPPLRERIEDIPILLQYFLEKTNKHLGRAVRGFSHDALAFLIIYQWPGNVRELRNVVVYVCNIRNDGMAKLDDLPPYLLGKKKECARKGSGAIVQAEDLLIDEAMRLFGNSIKGKREAAKYLGISVSTLYRRLSEN